jgi:DNA-binding IclR family transcriptional regulator
VTDIDTFRQQLAQTRAQGYATVVDEAEIGTAAIAVPFYCNGGEGAQVAGTISVAGPSSRIQPSRFAELSQDLHKAAREISAIWPLRIRQRDFTMYKPAVDTARELGEVEAHSRTNA